MSEGDPSGSWARSWIQTDYQEDLQGEDHVLVRTLAQRLVCLHSSVRGTQTNDCHEKKLQDCEEPLLQPGRSMFSVLGYSRKISDSSATKNAKIKTNKHIKKKKKTKRLILHLRCAASQI